jgi:hypothetical protein
MLLRARSVFALALLFAAAAGAQAQSVTLEEVPVLPVSPTTRTKVQVRVVISGCGDLTMTPFIDGHVIEIRHRVEGCASPFVIGDSVDLGFLPAGTYTIKVMTYLDPSFPLIEDSGTFTVTSAGESHCTPGPTVACFFNRFQAQVRYRPELNDGVTNRLAKVLTFPGLQGTIYETALFYLDDPTNAEVMVKMLDQGTDSLGRRVVAVLYGTATPLKLEIDVRDNSTTVTKVYRIPLGQMQGGADFAAFLK